MVIIRDGSKAAYVDFVDLLKLRHKPKSTKSPRKSPRKTHLFLVLIVVQ